MWTDMMRKSSINWLFPGVVFLFLLVDPLMLEPRYYILLAVLGVLSVVLADLKGSFRWRWLSSGLLVLVPLAVSAASASFAWNSLEYFVTAASAVLLAVTMSQIPRDQLRVVVPWGLLCVLVPIVIPIIDQSINQLLVLGHWGLWSVPAGPLLNPNVLGRVLGLVGVFFLVGRRESMSGSIRVCIAACLFLGVLWTGSRGAILALVVATGVMVIRQFSIPRWGWVAGLVVGLAFLAVLVGPIDHVTNLQRIQLVQSSWSMTIDHPLSGVGPWNFGLEYSFYSSDTRWQRHPHSLPFWLMTTTGFLGVAVIGWWAWSRRWYVNSRLMILLTFVLCHELVDTMLWIPGVLYLTVIVVVPLVDFTESDKEFPGPRWRARWGYGFLAVILLVGIFLAVSHERYRDGIVAAQQERWHTAREAWTGVPTAFGLAHRALAASRRGDVKNSRELLKQATTTNPMDPYYPHLLSRMTEGDTAERYREKARRLDPRDVLSFRDPPEDWGRDNYPADFRRIGEARLRPDKIRRHPRRAGWYLPMVDRAIRRDRYAKCLERIRVILGYPEITRFTRIELESRRRSCYRMGGQEAAAERARERLEQLRRREPSLRATYHRFFYRRTGLDHAFFQ